MPIAGRFLPNILTTSVKIVHKLKQVKINKRQCQTLIERIQMVIFYLQKPELLKRLQSNDDPLNQTLANLQQFLERCYDFISSFVNYSQIRKFISSSSYKEKFNRLYIELQMYYSELTLAINIKNFTDHQQNEHLHTLILTTIVEQLKGLLIQNNVQPALNYVLKEESKPSNDIFKNGIWSNLCFEYSKWYGPFQHQMKFNFNDNTCDGYGEDHIGPFILTGSFSKETQEINIVVSYVVCCSELEMDDQYRFRLTWNEKLGLFEGLKYEPVESATLPSGLFEMSFVQST
jgi:hypothetical protein